MFNRVSIVLLIIMLSTGLVATLQWDEKGVPIRQGSNIEWTRAMTEVDGGDVVYVWSDTRLGDRDVWGQRIDNQGNLLWGEDGILINGEIDRQEDIVIIDAGGGDVIVAWVDFRHEVDGDVYAQKLDSQGNLLWDEEGVPLCVVPGIQISLNIINNGAGGAYVIWHDHRGSGSADIYGTHILADGTIAPGWDENGNPITAGTGSRTGHTLWEDGTGGGIMAWVDSRSAVQNLYMQRFDEEGNLLWGEDGLVLCDAPGDHETVRIAPDVNGGFIFAWRDKRDNATGHIYAHKVDLDGNFAWSDELEICILDGTYRNPRITSASDGGAIVVWEDTREDPTKYDLYAQKIDSDGNTLWRQNGAAVVVENYHQQNPRLIGDDNGGAYIVWEDQREGGHPNENIYMQLMDSSGNPVFETNGMPVCDANREQFSPNVKISNGHIFVAWGDKRDSSIGMYSQIYDSNHNEILAHNGELFYYGLDGDGLDITTFYYDGKTTLLWLDSRHAAIANQIYMQTLNPDGSTVLPRNGAPVTSTAQGAQRSYDAVLVEETGEIGIVWQENVDGIEMVKFQVVDNEGNYIYFDDGVFVAPWVFTDQLLPKVSAKYENGQTEFFVGFRAYSMATGSTELIGQRIVDGEIQWGDEGAVIYDDIHDAEIPYFVEDYYVWRYGDFLEESIRMKKVDDNGNTAAGWPEDGLVICGDSSPEQANVKSIKTPEGVIVIWNDYRNDVLDVYAQHVSDDGEILWQEDGMPLIVENNEQNFRNFAYKDDHLYLSWRDFRTGQSNDIYLQKYDDDGAPLWDENGVGVAVVPHETSHPYLTLHGDYTVVVWSDYEQEAASVVRVQKFNHAGGPMWASSGMIVVDQLKNQRSPQAVSDNEESIYVMWEDTRSSGKTDIVGIYAQKISTTTSIQEDEVLPTEPGMVLLNHPNPFKHDTAISLSIKPTEYTNPEVKIYNVRGQLVRSLQAAQQSVTWDGRNNGGQLVASGIYFYRFESKEYKSNTNKMIYIR